MEDGRTDEVTNSTLKMEDGRYLTFANHVFGPYIISVTEKAINWGNLVPLKIVKETYTKFETKFENSNAHADGTKPREHVGDIVLTDNGTSGDVTTKGDAAEAPVESDAFRIHPASDSQPGEIFQLRSNDLATRENDTLNVVRTIFDHVCAVFPSAFEHMSGTVKDERFPYVTIQSSYLVDTSDSDLLEALDSIASSAFKTPFLSQELSFSDKSLPWLLARLSDMEEANLEAKVPLYSLLLARVELAAAQAFLKSRDLEAVQVVNAPKSDVLSGESLPGSLVLLSNVLSCAHATNDLALTVDLQTRRNFMEHFAHAYLEDNISLDSLRLENLMLTPLHLMLSAYEKRNEVDFASWDAAIFSASSRMTTRGIPDEDAGTEVATNGATHGAELHRSKIPEPTETAVSPGRNKRKKRKSKRKVRYLSSCFST